jgi:hypothetical protein
MKNILAQAIERSSARLSLRDFFKDLLKDIINDEGLNGLIVDLIADDSIDDIGIEYTKPDGVIEVEETGAVMMTEKNSVIVDSKPSDTTDHEETDAVMVAETYDDLFTERFYYTFYFNIIYMLATGHNSNEIIYLFMNQYPLPVEEKQSAFT